MAEFRPAALFVLGVLVCLPDCRGTAPERETLLSIGSTAVVLTAAETTSVGFVLDDGVRKFESPPRTYPAPPDPGVWESRTPALRVETNGGITAQQVGQGFVVVSAASRRDSAFVTVIADGAERSDYAMVTPGLAHACALDTGGKVFCWGTNSHGELGNGQRKAYTAYVSPVALPTSDAYAALSAGGQYTCGLRADGRAACWGYSLGSSTTPNLDTTIPTLVNTTLRFVSVSSGSDHRCALTADSTAYCWGLNAAGQLGTGDTKDRDVPTGVTGNVRFASISAGDLHTCGLTGAGAAYCWGDNVYGELGIGAPSARSAEPVLVGDGLSFRMISAGTESTCAITVDFKAYCWGRNFRGKLGSGDLADRASPQPVATTTSFTSISTRSSHTCALDIGGAAYCWGDNTWGQLGTGVVAGQTLGATDPYLVMQPVAVHGGISFVRLDAGNDYTCGVATSGRALCWGVNRTGQLGIGRRRTPVGRDYVVTTPMENEPTVVRRP